MRNIRWPEGIDTIMRLIVSITLSTYRVLLTRYRPDELERLSEKYIREWQAPFRQIRPPNIGFTADSSGAGNSDDAEGR